MEATAVRLEQAGDKRLKTAGMASITSDDALESVSSRENTRMKFSATTG
jgi:hypothetical protein